MLTIDQKRTIQTMWRDNFKGSQIAAKIGATRGAVMGYVHRAIGAGILNLKTVQSPPKPVTLPLAKPTLPKTSIPKLKESRNLRTYTIENITNRIHNSMLKRTTVNPEPEIVAKGVPLLKLREHHCRHIFDENATHTSLYCGRDVFKRSYCEEHYLLYYVPTPKIRAKLKNANNTGNRSGNRSNDQTERLNRTINFLAKIPNDQLASATP